MSHPKNELNELMQYLTPHELAELEKLATPPTDASLCVAVFDRADDGIEAKATRDYIEQHGCYPPSLIRVVFE
ncbi:hypothetical protein GTP23_12830 [Pseudoduganella sp. FT93W]|uniref:Uncharacterized protein n=1 Tax=Duganella fentianensis TaxID=2692177 RepID=A0A845HY35_9BURK|nr:hypothetical protein [Duganella fentianensis]MYN45933.1 hypothetical protein [Duganella fentianensis]